MYGKYGKITTLGPKRGICNICGNSDTLTEDHVPPKGSIRVKQVEMFHIVDILGVENPPKKKGRKLQDGVKFRTLCPFCNNKRLGLEYDPALNHFSNIVSSYLKTSITLPERLSVNIKPNRVIRAVLGHLLAVSLNCHDLGTMTMAAREYFLKSVAHFPSGMKIYYWIYPYNKQVLVRDGLLFFCFSKKIIRFWLMKYFPLGFIVTWEQPEEIQIDLECLDFYAGGDINSVVDVPVNLKNIPSPVWPEEPTDDCAVLYGNRAISAIQKT